MSRGCAALLFMLWCSLALLGEADDEIRIGVVLDTTTPEGQGQNIAIKMAAQDLNSTALRLHLKLIPVSYDNSSLLEAASAAENLVNVWGARAIIGSGTSFQVASMADRTKNYRVPFLSLSSPASSMAFNHDSFVDMSFPTTARVQFLADFVKSNNWQRVILVYEDDTYGGVSSSETPLLSRALEDAGSVIDRRVVFPPLVTMKDPQDVVQKQLEAMKTRLCGVFILLRSSKQLAMHIFREAYELGLMDKGYVWILGDDVSSFNPSFVSSYMQGVIGLKAYFKETTKSYRNFLNEFQSIHASNYMKANAISYDEFEPRYSFLRAYDAVHTISSAGNRTRTLKNISILDGILSTKFQGLSGLIEFEKNGNLKLKISYVAFHVINFVGRSYKELGFWSYGKGFYNNTMDMSNAHNTSKLQVLSWPGGLQGRPPGGWGKLKILVPEHTTFKEFVQVLCTGNGSITCFDGFCIDVFKTALQMLPYYLEADYNVSHHKSYDEHINEVAIENYHAAVGDFTILADRMEKVTFTEPYASSGLTMMVPVRRARTWMFWRPFEWRVWTAIIVASLYTAIVLWFLQYDPNRPWYNQFSHNVWQIISSIFYQFGSIRNSLAKMVLIPWLFVVLLLLASYNANLSAILTTEKLKPFVRELTKVGCDGDSFVVRYLNDVLRFKNNLITNMTSPDNYTVAFSNGEITAAYLEIPYLRVFLSKYNGYTVHGETYRLGGFAFAFQKGSPLANDFSVAILSMQEDGTLKRLEEKWFTFTLYNSPMPEDIRNREGLVMDDFLWLFLFTIGTSTIVLLMSIAQSRRCVSRCSWSMSFVWMRLVGFAGRIWNVLARARRSRNVVAPTTVEMTDVDAGTKDLQLTQMDQPTSRLEELHIEITPTSNQSTIGLNIYR